MTENSAKSMSFDATIKKEGNDQQNLTKYKAKDSVFCDLFSEPRYQMELYKVLHPEDQTITMDDFKTVTIENIVTNQMFNDLGFMARSKLIMLVEALSKWSINIIPRINMYCGESMNNYILETGQKKYSSKKMKLPKPEFYVIYTGEKKNINEWYSMADEFYGGDKTFIDAKVRVLRGREDVRDIISQYVTFAKILDQQEKIFGRTKMAITETIRICIEQDVLKEYLKRRTTEVTNIMTSLYDQEQATKEYAEEYAEKYAEGQREEGKKEGRSESLKEVVRKMVAQGFSDEQIKAITDYGEKDIKNMRLESNNL